MGKILQFPDKNTNSDGFTPEARERWESIPGDVRLLLLNNAYCSTCKKPTGIRNPGGSIQNGALLLHGTCMECGNAIARVVD
jgi:hypothetical protein